VRATGQIEPRRLAGLYRGPGAVFAVHVNERPMWPAGGDGSAAPLPGQLPDETRAAVTVERRDSTAVITVTGEIDIANAEAAEQQIMRGIAGEPTTVTLDLTGLHYIDSAGLWILFRLGTSLMTADIAGEVVIPADGPVRRMVETAGVSAAIAVRTA
jgi:anti-anti-sigma factor